MADGTTITMRTSNYATFANETLPLGTGEITGILTRYNNYVQIVINSPADLVGFTAPVERQTVFSVNYSNAFNEGWLQTGTGNPWQTMVNNNFSGFFVNPSADEDYYLISPAIHLDNTSEPELSFTHRAPQGFDPNTMMCFYTPNCEHHPVDSVRPLRRGRTDHLQQFQHRTPRRRPNLQLPPDVPHHHRPVRLVPFRHQNHGSGTVSS